ncbi:glycosyltransferase family 87 protein [Rhodovulum sp. DZ06]|uniref:glycosyltransferase family 87 protein n=1 Tax=Rhodovulum sp. DZ06 TaxID=3425126 RepID=UPI003D32D787
MVSAMLCIVVLPIWLLHFQDAKYLDLRAFWIGAQAAFNLGEIPYGEGFLAAQRQVFDGHSSLWVYPPEALALFWPLSFLTFEQAMPLSVAASVAAAGLGGVVIGRVAPLRDDLAMPLATALLLLSNSTRATLALGQVSVLVVACCALFLLGLRDRRFALLSAAALIAAVMMKLYFVVLLALPILALNVRWIAYFGLGALLSLGWALAVLPSGIHLSWLTEVLWTTVSSGDLAGQMEISRADNHSVASHVVRAVGQDSALYDVVRFVIPLALFGVTAAASLLAARARGWGAPTLADLGLWMVAVYIAVPNSWVYYAVFAGPGVVAWTAEAWRMRRRVELALAALATLWLLQSPVFLARPLLGWAPDVETQSLGATLVGVMIWLFLLLHLKAVPQGDGRRTAAARG